MDPIAPSTKIGSYTTLNPTTLNHDEVAAEATAIIQTKGRRIHTSTTDRCCAHQRPSENYVASQHKADQAPKQIRSPDLVHYTPKDGTADFESDLRNNIPDKNISAGIRHGSHHSIEDINSTRIKFPK